MGRRGVAAALLAKELNVVSLFSTHLAVMSNLPAGVKIAKVTDARDVIYTNENTHDRLTDAVWRDDRTLLTIGHGRKMATHKI